jgi:SPASM domain peptide maturase of grasp-with-spasm system
MTPAYFKLYANCIPVKGISSSIICDIQKGSYWKIPNLLASILDAIQNNGLTIEALKAHYSNEYDAGIDSYFDFLINLGLGFYTDTPESFPPLSLEWDWPADVTNAILDVYSLDDYPVETALMQLSELGCSAVQLRFYTFEKLDRIYSTLAPFAKSRIKSFELVLKYGEDLSHENLLHFYKQNLKISSLVFHSCPEDKTETIREWDMDRFDVIFIRNKITSSLNCGVINKIQFSSNLSLFTESQHHNSCLNRKIAIDVDGSIKNCPSLPQSFGNIKETQLREALEHPDFKKYWNITKDQIEVCKDCEFRYICTDCRAYTENPDDNYSKPLKCGYNPYTNTWEEWSTHPLKQQAIDYYGMRKILPDFNFKPDYASEQTAKSA